LASDQPQTDVQDRIKSAQTALRTRGIVSRQNRTLEVGEKVLENPTEDSEINSLLCVRRELSKRTWGPQS